MKGYVTEGSSSNIWIINKNNEILTREKLMEKFCLASLGGYFSILKRIILK